MTRLTPEGGDRLLFCGLQYFQVDAIHRLNGARATHSCLFLVVLTNSATRAEIACTVESVAMGAIAAMKTLAQVAKVSPSRHFFEGYRDGLRWDAEDAEKEQKKAQMSQAIVTALEDSYTSGVEALLSFQVKDGTIFGRFRDGVRTFAYTLKDDEIEYWLVTGAERADSLLSEPVWRRDLNPPTATKKERKCKVGIKCGNSCINAKKSCKSQPSPKAQQAIKTAKSLAPDVLGFEQEFNRAVESERSKTFEQDLDKAVQEQESAKAKKEEEKPAPKPEPEKPKKAESGAEDIDEFGPVDGDFLEPVEEPKPQKAKKKIPAAIKASKAKPKDEDEDEQEDPDEATESALESEVWEKSNQIMAVQKMTRETALKRARIEVFSERLRDNLGVSDPKKATAYAKALDDFTGDNFRLIRKVESGQKRSLVADDPQDWKRAKKSARDLGEFLSSAPKAEGSAFRGLTFKTQTQYDDFMKSIEGGTMELNAMSSFSSSESVVKRFARKGADTQAVIIRVKSNMSGVDLSSLSQYPDEKEVLVPKGTKYRVTKTSVGADGRTYVDVEEDDGAPKSSPNTERQSKAVTQRQQGTISSGFKSDTDWSPSTRQQIKKYASYAERKAIGDEDFEPNAEIWKDISRKAQDSSYIGIRDTSGNLQSAATYIEQDDALFVEYLASAPWNVKGDDSRRMKGAGSAAIEALVLESVKRGRGGALRLESLEGAVGFYEKIGFQRKSNDNVPEMELSAEDAKKWLDSRGVRYDATESLEDLEEKALGSFAKKRIKSKTKMTKKRKPKDQQDRFVESDPDTFLTVKKQTTPREDGYRDIMKQRRISR